MPSVKEEVVAFITERLNLPSNLIHESSHFIADLGLNSLRSLELICDAEDRFNIRIPDRAISGLIQVKDLIAFIEQNRGTTYVEPKTTECERSI